MTRWANFDLFCAAKRVPQQHPNYVENGRTYHGYRRGAYLFPCDEQEQDRLDIYHKLITEARHGDGLIYCPHQPNGRILDLGCGTGIWAIDVAHKYPESFVLGVDLAATQPRNRPRNCDFYSPWDFEHPWCLGENYWDLIHLQMGLGSVASWPSLYKKVFAHLRPGAWFEHVEVDFEPRAEGNQLENKALSDWWKWMKTTTENANRPIAHSSQQTINWLEEEGFVEVVHQIVGLPLNPWHDDEHEREVGRWYNLALCESLESLTLAPLCRYGGPQWDPSRVKELTNAVKFEAYDKNLRAYNLLHIYQARKPPNAQLPR
jgi:trans-aconitate methyltransferase